MSNNNNFNSSVNRPGRSSPELSSEHSSRRYSGRHSDSNYLPSAQPNTFSFFNMLGQGMHSFYPCALPAARDENTYNPSLVPFARLNPKSLFIYEPGGTYRKNGCTVVHSRDGSEQVLEGILTYVCYFPFTNHPHINFSDVKTASDQAIFTQKLIKKEVKRELSSYFKKNTFYKLIDFLDRITKVEPHTLDILLYNQIDNIVAMNFMLSNIIFNFREEYKNIEQYRKILNNGLSDFVKENDNEKQTLLKKSFVYFGLNKELNKNNNPDEFFSLENKFVDAQDNIREHFLDYKKKRNSAGSQFSERTFLLNYKALLWKTIEICEEIISFGVETENGYRRAAATYKLLHFSNNNIQPIAENIYCMNNMLLSTNQIISCKLMNLKKINLNQNNVNFLFKQGDFSTINSLQTLNSRRPFNELRADRTLKAPLEDHVEKEYVEFDKTLKKYGK